MHHVVSAHDTHMSRGEQPPAAMSLFVMGWSVRLSISRVSIFRGSKSTFVATNGMLERLGADCGLQVW
jgi:hypothetical protein